MREMYVGFLPGEFYFQTYPTPNAVWWNCILVFGICFRVLNIIFLFHSVVLLFLISNMS